MLRCQLALRFGDLRRGGPHRDALADLGGGVGHGADHGAVVQARLQGGHLGAGDDRDHQGALAGMIPCRSFITAARR